jgi:hypothetical protein
MLACALLQPSSWLQLCACCSVSPHSYLIWPFGKLARLLLQRCTDLWAAGGLEMPSAVYLLDMQQPRRKVAEVLELVRPMIASTQNTKVGLRQAGSTVECFIPEASSCELQTVACA